MRFRVLPMLMAVAGMAQSQQVVTPSTNSPATFSGFNDWLSAEARGVRIGSDGRLRLAPGLRRVGQLSEGVVWAAVSDGAGGVYLSAGTEGKLFHYSGGNIKPLAQVKGGVIFAMAKLGNDLLVAPSGEGKLFRVSPAGDVKPFADIEAKVVWGISTLGGDVVVAGGGEKGALLLLARESGGRRMAELPEETAFTAMTPDGVGGFYLGTHGRGLVLHYSGDKLETLMATGFEEVRAIALSEGRVFIGANNGLANRMASGNLEKRESYLSETGTATKSAVLRLDKSRVPETLWQSNQGQIFSLAIWRGQLLVGTGNRARIFSIPLSDRDREQEAFASLQDLGTAQATAFVASGSDLLAVGSNPAEIHQITESQGLEGTLESRVLKGNPLADWGRAYVDSEQPTGTAVELQVRIGSTETPDSTWSTWTPPLRSGERPGVPPARFAQFRLKLSSSRGGATPAVDSVKIYWTNRNLAPAWDGIDVMPTGVVITRSAPPDDIGIERVPLETQKLIPALQYAGAEKRSFRRASQAFVFRVSDPNNDTLQYRIRLLPDQGNPIELEKAWKEKFFTFDTLPVPDGRYRLEVTASDAPTQPFNAVLTSTFRTSAFMVDHTPPTISDLSATTESDGVHVRFTAQDATSVIKEAALSADGEAWLQILPEDRIFDSQTERFDVLLPKTAVRGDRVLVRVVDAHSNEQTAFTFIGAAGKK